MIGGVFTSPRSQTRGLSSAAIIIRKLVYVRCDMAGKFFYRFAWLRLNVRSVFHKLFALGRTSTGRELGALGSKKGLCVSGSGSSEPPIERYLAKA